MNRRRMLAALVAAPAALATPGVAFAQDHANYSGAKMPEHGDIDPRNDERVISVTSTLSCNCGTCPHEPVNTCTCGTASRLRAEVAAHIWNGKTPEQARLAMIDQYGYDIVPKPPFGGLNLLAWIGPFVLIGIVGTAVTLWLRRSSKKQTALAAKPESGSSPAPVVQDAYLARIEAELKGGG